MTLQCTPATPRRKRRLTPLKERFIRSGLSSFNDLEIIELLLSLGYSQRDYKRLAKACIERFRSLREFLMAMPRELLQVGISRRAIFNIKLLRELPIEILKQKIIKRNIYSSSKEVFDYLYYSMRDLRKEVFKIA